MDMKLANNDFFAFLESLKDGQKWEQIEYKRDITVLSDNYTYKNINTSGSFKVTHIETHELKEYFKLVSSNKVLIEYVDNNNTKLIAIIGDEEDQSFEDSNLHQYLLKVINKNLWNKYKTHELFSVLLNQHHSTIYLDRTKTEQVSAKAQTKTIVESTIDLVRLLFPILKDKYYVGIVHYEENVRYKQIYRIKDKRGQMDISIFVDAYPNRAGALYTMNKVVNGVYYPIMKFYSHSFDRIISTLENYTTDIKRCDDEYIYYTIGNLDATFNIRLDVLNHEDYEQFKKLFG